MVEITSPKDQGDPFENRKALKMRAFKPWVEALHIDPLKFETWLTEIPKHESVTFWCLIHGHLRSIEYLEWAKNFYGLPAIDEKYFRLAANRDLWTKIQSVANWSPSLLPVEEWDGTVFVACVEPPSDINWSFPVQYVLAPARELVYHWERLSNDPTKVTNPSVSGRGTTPAAKLTLNIQDIAKNPPNEKIADDLSLAMQLGENSNSTLEVNSVVDAPDGLSLSLKPPTLNLDPAEPPKVQIAPVVQLQPEAQRPQSQTGFVLVKNENSDPKVGAIRGEIDSDRQAPHSLDDAESEDQAVAWCFQQLKPHFRYAWILKVKGDDLIPYKWDSQARAKGSQAEQPIDLKQPSLFRIVARTRMPYHGHVVDSPINTAFFKLWGLRETPPHVTAVPLLEGGKISAILICAGEKPAQADAVLRSTEKVANQFMTVFVKTKAA